jgi:polyhydroxyalkanoate synthesis regulator phasin
MAFHIKSATKFKILIGFSALAISGVAALFSVTGISSLFSGAFLPIVFMMSILEFGKIVVASYLARYWYELSKTLKSYFIIAVLVLMAITSAGIFGYLSDAYQKTKGDYTITENQMKVMEVKKNFFIQRRDRLERDKQSEAKSKESNQTRADSLTSRRESITRTRQDIKESESRITSLEQQISSVEDSIGYYDNKIVEVSTINIKGELGPLKFIADAFGTTMDTITKWLILMIIFVFDPLAILLFVSLSTMIRKDAGPEINQINLEKQSNPKIIEPDIKIQTDTAPVTIPIPKSEVFPKPIKRVRPIKPVKKREEIKKINIPQDNIIPVIEMKSNEPESKIEKKEEPEQKEEPEPVVENTPEMVSEEIIIPEPITMEEPKQHLFYYGEEMKPEITKSIELDVIPDENHPDTKEPHILWQTSNSRYRFPK